MDEWCNDLSKQDQEPYTRWRALNSFLVIPLEYELEVRNATLLYEIWSIMAKYECNGKMHTIYNTQAIVYESN